MYVQSKIQSSVWTYSADNPNYQLFWVQVSRNTFFGTLYHPPKPTYKQVELMDYMDACVEELSCFYSAYHIILAGDLNKLPDEVIEERTGLKQVVQQPTRGTNMLDRI